MQKRKRIAPRQPKNAPAPNPLQALVEDAVVNALQSTLPRNPGLRRALEHVQNVIDQVNGPREQAPQPRAIQLTKQLDGSYK